MKAGTAFAAVAVLAAVAPATAAADQRYASPSGTPADACTQPDPCDFEKAAEGAAAGDEVIVAPGSYSVADQVQVSADVVVQGVTEQPPPEIALGGAGFGISADADTVLSWLRLRYSAGGDAVVLDGAAADQLQVANAGAGSACRLSGLASAVDSVCWAAGIDGEAVSVDANGATEGAVAQNVTAVGTGAGSVGIDVSAVNPSGIAVLSGSNVIAQGQAADIRAVSSSPAQAVIDLGFSNFDTRATAGAGSSATQPGSGSNQAQEPIFANPLAGDFHQGAESPTIDSGNSNIFFTDRDIDGEDRRQGFWVDIGADEAAPAATPPDGNPPETRILKKPGRRTTGRRPKFKFGTTEPVGATFYCSLDGKPYAACKSPKRMRVDRGRHTFRVYSVDGAGNTDPSPDAYSWKVRPKSD